MKQILFTASQLYLQQLFMQAKIGNDIITAKNFLVNGELVAIPTETVYGLAANALNADAVVKIFEVKNRPFFNPLIIHFANWKQVEKYVSHIPEKAKILAKKFTPGPLTFLLDKQDIIPDIVTAGNSTVAIRIPAHPLTLTLLETLDFPLAAPSANPFGYISPTSAQHVFDSLSERIPYILDGGKSVVGVESTIIGFDKNENVILHRLGGISIESIEEALGEKILIEKIASKAPVTPGQLKSHYAPNTPLYTGDIDELLKRWIGKTVAIISFTKHYEVTDTVNQFILSPKGDLAEAAKNLFSALRLIDQLKVEVVLAEIFPDEGIGRAINDRLEKARVENK
jgi:L-threonylcarbamoyladenylate synthase